MYVVLYGVYQVRDCKKCLTLNSNLCDYFKFVGGGIHFVMVVVSQVRLTYAITEEFPQIIRT